MAIQLERNRLPNVRLAAGGYSVRRSTGSAKRQTRRSITPRQMARARGAGSANGRIGGPR